MINGKPGNRPKYLKPKLSQQKLVSLVADFERIEFFRFGPDFPLEVPGEHLSYPHSRTETISIRVNGQTKEVSNHLGDSFNRTKILKDLAERIRGAAVWNFENDEIPENFRVEYQTIEGNRIARDIQIRADGKITDIRYIPRKMEDGQIVTVPGRTKTIGDVSRQQIRQLIDEFEKAAFSGFIHSELASYDGCSNPPDPENEKRTSIGVKINRTFMFASLYQNCGPKPDTDAAKFEYMNQVIQRLLRSVGIGTGKKPGV